MNSTTVLLANEAGGGRGHVALLAAVAKALGPQLSIIAAIPSLRHAGELSSLCDRVERGPLLRYATTDEGQGNASWGDYLAACGFTQPGIVRAHLQWWRRKIVEEDASILVADYAPLAIWAAQGLKAEGWDIEVVSIGTGYGLPPARLHRFPQLMPDYSRQTTPEDEMLAVLNAVAREAGLAPLPHLPAIARADREIAFTLPHLDPYAADRLADETFVPVLSPLSPLSRQLGQEIFVYFSRGELEDPDLVAALEEVPLPRRGFLPGASAPTLARLRASGMVIESAPLSMAEIAGRARLVLGAGQHGLQCLATLAGLAQVAVPQHLEQLFHSRRSEAQGILRHVAFDRRTKDQMTTLIRNAWEDGALHVTAREAAQRLRFGYPANPVAELAERLAPQIARARRAYR